MAYIPLRLGSNSNGLQLNTNDQVLTVQLSTASLTGALSGSDWNVFNSKLTSTLSNGLIFVGNGSNIATPVALSGDATLINTGVITLAPSGVTAGTYGNALQIPQLVVDSKGRIVIANTFAIGGGTVSSVGLSMPNIFSVGNTPITTSGTFAVTLNNVNANTIFAGPDSSTGTPEFRALTFNDYVTATTPGTHTKITINNKGIVTSGTNFNSADVILALGFTPMQLSSLTGINPVSYNNTNGQISLNGLSNFGTTNQFISMNVAGTALEYKTIQGTANQVNVNSSSGFTTISLPQNINTTATPTFNQVSITNSPVNPNDVINKLFFDTFSNGISWKTVARAATTTSISLTGTQTVDNVVLIVGNRVLVKNQTTVSENGIYIVQSGAWIRSTDSSSGQQLVGASIFIDEGSTNADKGFIQTTNSPITLGSSSIIWVQNFGTGTYTADNTTITLTGNQFSISTNGISNLQINTSAAITRSKLASGTANHVIINDGSGVFSSEASLAISRGGTGLSSLGTSNQFLSVNPSTTALEYKTILGTTNQININSSSGFTTLSLPQNINTTATPTFGGVTLNGAVNYQYNLLSSNTTLSNVHYFIDVNTAGGSIQLTLPASTSNIGKFYIIKKTDSSANSVTILANGADLIDGNGSRVINFQYQSIGIISNGLNAWSII